VKEKLSQRESYVNSVSPDNGNNQNTQDSKLNIIDFEDFVIRYAEEKEEFAFKYKDKFILITYDTWIPCAEFGNRDRTTASLYQDSYQLINQVSFRGKKLRDIWDELEYIPL